MQQRGDDDSKVSAQDRLARYYYTGTFAPPSKLLRQLTSIPSRRELLYKLAHRRPRDPHRRYHSQVECAHGHWRNGLFMNWNGKQAGEGFEYHLLVIAITLALLIAGAGRWSVDGEIAKKLP